MRIYYASDVHGSEVCWRKFLNAATFYRADVLIMGGDLVGKAIVPITGNGKGDAVASFRGRQHELHSETEIGELEKEIRNSGFYPYRGTADEFEHLDASDEARDALFERVVRREIDRWITIADEKSSPAVSVFVIGGNDDPWFIDDQLRAASALTFCDQMVVQIGDIEMLSLSYANPTPWNSPRELDEPDLLALIESLAGNLHNPETAIFNLHVPPYASGLDDAPLLDETLKPVTRAGQVEVGPVGSTAVREVIEKYQPLLSLHGHIHESPGARRIGRTLAINPGSEYGSGRIHGALIEIKKSRIKLHQIVSG